MDHLQSKGRPWTALLTLLALLALSLPPAAAQDGAGAADAAGDAMGQYLDYARQQKGADSCEIAEAPAAAAEQLAVEQPAVEAAAGAAAAPAGNGKEKIEVTFKEAENDILSKEADQKLDVMVESLEFANADLRNVIRIIGERLDLNFIFDSEDISGKVTLRLRNIRLRDALNSILVTRRLAIVADSSGIFRIVPQEQIGRKSVETRTEVIQLNWISAVDVSKTMKNFLSEDVGKLEPNEESNSIIITDVPPHIKTVRELIQEIDIPERQVLIEARLADINTGAVRELGTTWNVSKPHENLANSEDRGLNLVDALQAIAPITEGVAYKGGAGTNIAFGDKIGIFGDTYDINAVFHVLESRNVVEILANPRVTTLNNVPAKISIIEKIPYIEAVSGPSSGTTTAEVEFEEAGVEIEVKPIITPSGFVRLEIKLKQKIFRERVGGGALDPPAIDERTADTNVIVRSENTVVLGGLRQQRKLEGMDGVPWLHRVPMFGWLFKDKNYDQSKLELVLMMTPRIISESTLPLTEQEQYLYNKIETDWKLPDYFFDDVKQPTDK